MVGPVRIFVGCAANHEDAESQAVLEWSIRKHSSLPIDITWMKQTRDVSSPWYVGPGVANGWDTRFWATPFSGFRWAIPEVCRFEGKAIYMDSDVIVMADIAELWTQAFQPGKFLVAKGGGAWRICVSMFNCAEAKKHIPPIAKMMMDPQAHKKMCALIREKPHLVQAFHGEWNCLDKEIGRREVDDPSIKAIHYTDMRSQPQLRHALPRLASKGKSHWYDGTGDRAVMLEQYPRINELFDELLIEACDNGFPPERYMEDEPFGSYKIRSKAA